jgi:hypothetical protein
MVDGIVKSWKVSYHADSLAASIRSTVRDGKSGGSGLVGIGIGILVDECRGKVVQMDFIS